jgi:uncharacterized protein YdeI (YjbR/CyaY-like superfamily)
MEIGKTYYAPHRNAWRSWLARHHATEKEIWLIYYKKNSVKPRIPYNDAVEEALCFGWIDSLTKPIDEEKYAQRFSPRKKTSKWSEMNLERVRRLMTEGKMTEAGLAALNGALMVVKKKSEHKLHETKAFKIPADILKELKKDKTVWENFQKFPESYKRIRIGWVDGSRNSPVYFKRRLQYFIKMTAKNKRFGMVQ